MQLFRNPGSFLIFALSASLKHYWSWVPYTSVFQLKSQSVSCSVMSDCLQPLEPTSLLCPWGSPDKNTGVGCDFLLWGIFLTQGSNPGILHCRQILYHLRYQEGRGNGTHRRACALGLFLLHFYYKGFSHKTTLSCKSSWKMWHLATHPLSSYYIAIEEEDGLHIE